MHSQHGGRGAPLLKLKPMQLGMLPKAAALKPHLTIKPVDVRQHSKDRDSLCQSSANSLRNLLKASGVVKQGKFQFKLYHCLLLGGSPFDCLLWEGL